VGGASKKFCILYSNGARESCAIPLGGPTNHRGEKMKVLLMSLVCLSVSVATADNKGKPSPAGLPQIKSPATVACESILGVNADASVLEYCEGSYMSFVAGQKYVAIAEMAKEVIKKDQALSQKMIDVGAAVIADAEIKSMLITQGAKVPTLGVDWGVGIEGGIVCEQATDGSYDANVIPGLYSCYSSSGVWIYYTQNTCGEYEGMELVDEELKINFQITEDGVIKASSINTKPLLVISSCAG